jgi:hypothetical protein
VGGIDLGNLKEQDDEKDEADTNGHVEDTEEKVNGRKPKKGVGAVEKETPEQERLRREKIEAEAQAERERKKKELLDNRRKRAGGKSEEANGAPADQAKDGKPNPMMEELKALRVDHPEHLLLFRSPTGYMAWGSDATTAAKILHLKTSIRPGDTTDRLSFQDEDFIRQLLEAGKKVAVVEKRGKETVVNEVAYAEEGVEEPTKEEASVEEPKVKTPPKPKGKPKAAAK